jgi:hypothetical protein
MGERLIPTIMNIEVKILVELSYFDTKFLSVEKTIDLRPVARIFRGRN